MGAREDAFFGVWRTERMADVGDGWDVVPCHITSLICCCWPHFCAPPAVVTASLHRGLRSAPVQPPRPLAMIQPTGFTKRGVTNKSLCQPTRLRKAWIRRNG